MATLADSLVTTISGNYGDFAGGDAPDHCVNLNEFIQISPFDRADDWVIVWRPFPESRKQINDNFANVEEELRVRVITPTSDDRLKEMVDEIVAVINANTVSGVNYQYVDGDTDLTNRQIPLFAKEIIVKFFLVCIDAAINYAATSAEGHNHDDRYYTEAEIDAMLAGGVQNCFVTITSTVEDVVADAVADTLTLVSADSKLTIAGASATDTLTFSVIQAQIDHDLLLNFAVNEHFTEASISHDNIADVSADDHHKAPSDAVFGVGWNGIVDQAPSKNAVYDKVAALPTTLYALDDTGLTAEAPPNKSVLMFNGPSGVWIDRSVATLMAEANLNDIGTKNHGDLNGLGNDDHTQYPLLDGTRQFSEVDILGGDKAYIHKDSRASVANNVIAEWRDSTNAMLMQLAYAPTAEKDIEIRFGDDENTKIGFPELGYFAFINDVTEFWLGTTGDPTVYFNYYVGSACYFGTAANRQTYSLFTTIFNLYGNSTSRKVAITPNSVNANPFVMSFGFQTSGLQIQKYLWLASGTGINEFSIDGTLAGNSDNAVPTEQAVKAYCDAIVIGDHNHDTATLQHDGVNSNGGAFSFATTGPVTFNQNVLTPTFDVGGGDFKVDADGYITDYPNMGAGQDEYVLTYDHATTKIKLAVATGGGSDAASMLGAANKAWVPLAYVSVFGNQNAEMDVVSGKAELIPQDIEPQRHQWTLTKPTKKTGLKLYITGWKYYLKDADVNNYVNTTYVIGTSDAGADTAIKTDPTNYDAIGLVSDTFVAVDVSAYEALSLQLAMLNPTDSAIGFLHVCIQCYYDT